MVDLSRCLVQKLVVTKIGNDRITPRQKKMYKVYRGVPSWKRNCSSSEQKNKLPIFGMALMPGRCLSLLGSGLGSCIRFASHLGNFAPSECESSVRFEHLKRSYEILLLTKKHSEKYGGTGLDSLRLCSQMSRLVQLFWFNHSTTKTSGIIMRQQPVSSSWFGKVAMEMMASSINVGRVLILFLNFQNFIRERIHIRVEKTPFLSTIFQSSVSRKFNRFYPKCFATTVDP